MKNSRARKFLVVAVTLSLVAACFLMPSLGSKNAQVSKSTLAEPTLATPDWLTGWPSAAGSSASRGRALVADVPTPWPKVTSFPVAKPALVADVPTPWPDATGRENA